MLGTDHKRSVTTKLCNKGRTNVLIGYRFITRIQARIFLNFQYTFGEKAEGFPRN